MKVLKKLTAIFIAATMFMVGSIGILPKDAVREFIFSASAADSDIVASGECGAYGDNLTWTLDSEGTLTISGEGDMYEYYATYAREWHDSRQSITRVQITNGVTSIGRYAFFHFTSLISITIPNSVTGISDYAFEGCTSLTSITIPDGVKSIGYNTFQSCSKLESIIIPDSVTSIGGGAFSDTPWLENKQKENPLVVINGILIDGDACAGDVIIPDNVTSIGKKAFESNKSLTSVTILDTVTSIERGAFSHCSNLKLITIPDSVTSIESGAFSYCSNLKLITIPDSVTDIDDSVFSGCTSLMTVKLSNSIESIGYFAFEGCTSLTSITIPDSVTKLGTAAFNRCTNLTSITIPDSIGSFGVSVFNDTPWLETQREENPLVIINGILIDGKTCNGDVIIPNNVKRLNIEAFSGCTSLNSITIPDSVTDIDDSVFSRCTSLNSITIPNSVTDIGFAVFSGCTSLISITIPDSVTSISDCTFDDCTSLTAITLSENITSIGVRAFARCTSLNSIIIPDGVTSIGEFAFEGCTSLTSITIPDSITNIGIGALECWSDFTIFFRGTQKTWEKIRLENNLGKNIPVEFVSKYNTDFIHYSGEEDSLQYPIYEEKEFVAELKQWIINCGYEEAFAEYLTNHKYQDLLHMTIDMPIADEEGNGYLIESDSEVKDIMTYLIFANNAQKYISNTMKTVNEKFEEDDKGTAEKDIFGNRKEDSAYVYFLKRVKDFQSTYYHSQISLHGENTGDYLVSDLTRLKLARVAIDSVTYLQGSNNTTISDVANGYRFITDMYKLSATEESPKYYNDLYYYIMSGGDTQYLESDYAEKLSDYAQIASNTHFIYKVNDPDYDFEVTDYISLGLSNLAYYADKSDKDYAGNIHSIEAAWDNATTLSGFVNAATNFNIFGVASGAYKLSKKYIDTVKQVYENAEDDDAGWYALTYFYLKTENEPLLYSIVDPNTGNAAWTSDSWQNGFPRNTKDYIENKIIDTYYSGGKYINKTYTPNEDFRMYLWKACNNMSAIYDIDCNQMRNYLLEYMLAKINYDNDITGIPCNINATSENTSLGKVEGSGNYLSNTSVTLKAIPYENVTFSGWYNTATGELVSNQSEYTLVVYSDVSLQARFVTGSFKTASNPVISFQPVNSTYYAGQVPNPLSIVASSKDGGNISIDWYQNVIKSNKGGVWVGEGNDFIPSTAKQGHYYYYAIVSNSLTSFVGLEEKNNIATIYSDVVTVTVNHPIITGIDVIPPSKTEYKVGENLNKSNIIVNVIYSDGNIAKSNDYNLEYDFSDIGKKTVRISYWGYSYYFTVDVIRDETISTTNTTTTTTATTTPITTTTTTTITTTTTTKPTTTTTTTTKPTTTTTSATTSTTTTTTTSTTTSTTTTTTTTSTTTSTTTTTTTTSTTTLTTTTTTSTTTTTTSTTTTATSTTTSMTTITPPTTTEPAYLLGDVNEDGSVDSSDASLVLAEYAKIQTGGAGEFTDIQYKAADVNKDGVVDSSDASKILAYYAMVSTGKKPTWD